MEKIKTQHIQEFLSDQNFHYSSWNAMILTKHEIIEVDLSYFVF